ncbi:MAG: zinc ribbon domain-containing protein [Deltaproteobacteria bacterium]|nr:MAG: zinc ribbon domain-containing protein [Deltaproteobacteria bacterium]
MPIYEYRCNECEMDFEKLVSLSSPGEVACPFCGSKNIRKKISLFTSDTGGESCTGTGRFT